MASKDTYLKQYIAQLRTWDAGLKDWKARAHGATEAMRPVYQETLRTLGAHRAGAQKKFDELASYSEEAWEPLKAMADEAWHGLVSATEKAGIVFGAAVERTGRR